MCATAVGTEAMKWNEDSRIWDKACKLVWNAIK